MNNYLKLQDILGGDNSWQQGTSATDILNEMTLGININILSSYIMGAYRFEGLPKEIDQNLLWAILTQHSKGVMFLNEKTDKFMFLPFQRQDTKAHNFMYMPPFVKAYDFTKKQYNVRTVGKPNKDEYEGQIMYMSNTSRFNMDLHQVLYFYASKMTQIDRSIDIRRHYHRAPVAFSGSKELEKSFQKLFADISDFKAFYLMTDYMKESLNATNMDANYINDKLYSEKRQYQNEFLNLWGINNNMTEGKKERQIEDEVNANNEQLLINRSNVLNSLQQFCDGFNEKFGCNVTVSYEHDFIEKSMENDLFDMFGGDEE